MTTRKKLLLFAILAALMAWFGRDGVRAQTPVPGAGTGLGGSGGSCGSLGGDVTGTCAANAVSKLSGATASQAVVVDASKNVGSVAYGSASAASSLVQRDASQNAFANNFFSKGANVTSASTTTTMTAASAWLQNLTGTQFQFFNLPNATTLVVGTNYLFSNNSTALMTIKDSTSAVVQAVPAAGMALVTLIDSSTAAGSWDVHYFLPLSTNGGVSAGNIGNYIVQRDGGGTIIGQGFDGLVTSNVASGSTTTFTQFAARTQILTGSTTHTFKLPDMTTLAQAGSLWRFYNNSSGLLTLVDNASATITTVPAGGLKTLLNTDNSSAAGTWTFQNGSVTSSVTLTANAPVFGNGGSDVIVGTRTGNTTKVVTNTGTNTSGNCTQWDASGNLVDAGIACPTANQSVRSFGAGFDGGGSALTTSKVTYVTVPFACTITGYNITADTGTISFDLWKIATGTAIPTVTNTILTGGYLALSTGTALHSTTTSGFTSLAVSAFDIVAVKIQTVASATLASLVIACNAN